MSSGLRTCFENGQTERWEWLPNSRHIYRFGGKQTCPDTPVNDQSEAKRRRRILEKTKRNRQNQKGTGGRESKVTVTGSR